MAFPYGGIIDKQNDKLKFAFPGGGGEVSVKCGQRPEFLLKIHEISPFFFGKHMIQLQRMEKYGHAAEKSS